MSFIHPLLLGGLLLAGLPIVMHLIMQQKPKHLLFPAFRFLQQKYRTNQRKIRLRHLLLLLLRILVIVFITLALARPRVLSERLGFTAEQPVAAVLVIDTSPSMEYAVNGVSRLDEAKERVKELLEELAEGSRVAVLDTAGYSSSWLSSMAGAREVVAEMTIRPGARPVTDALANALKLFGELVGESTPGSDELVRVLYIFSDRTAGCWEPSRAADLLSAKSQTRTADYRRPVGRSGRGEAGQPGHHQHRNAPASCPGQSAGALRGDRQCRRRGRGHRVVDAGGRRAAGDHAARQASCGHVADGRVRAARPKPRIAPGRVYLGERRRDAIRQPPLRHGGSAGCPSRADAGR
jgi:hypothetical protein